MHFRSPFYFTLSQKGACHTWYIFALCLQLPKKIPMFPTFYDKTSASKLFVCLFAVWCHAFVNASAHCKYLFVFVPIDNHHGNLVWYNSNNKDTPTNQNASAQGTGEMDSTETLLWELLHAFIILEFWGYFCAFLPFWGLSPLVLQN